MILVVIPLENGIQERIEVGEIFILTSVHIAFVSSVNDGVFFDDAHTPTLASLPRLRERENDIGCHPVGKRDPEKRWSRGDHPL
jgi:hypothetical protein